MIVVKNLLDISDNINIRKFKAIQTLLLIYLNEVQIITVIPVIFSLSLIELIDARFSNYCTSGTTFAAETREIY